MPDARPTPPDPPRPTPPSEASPAAPASQGVPAPPHDAGLSSSLHLPLDESHGLSDRPSTLVDAEPSAPYATFELGEAAVVLSHYDLGVIQGVREYRRGSRHSPKLLVKSEKGAFVLKRRAHGRDEPVKVAFTHTIQRHLAKAGYPLPRLALTRSGQGSMLSISGRIYELFEYIPGQLYDQSLHATYEAGQALALFHRLLAHERPGWDPPGSSFHRSSHVGANLQFIPHRLQDESIEPVATYLRGAYEHAGEQADAAGLATWPRQIVHGDWHPGNMLFRASKIVAVIDYDTARVLPRVLDIANGTLQFSITRQGDNPSVWPDEPDEGRLKRFCRGYDSMAETVISTGELEAIPWLMIEAMIAEAALPIAATGRFGRLEAAPFLRMVERKVRWLADHTARIPHLLG